MKGVHWVTSLLSVTLFVTACNQSAMPVHLERNSLPEAISCTAGTLGVKLTPGSFQGLLAELAAIQDGITFGIFVYTNNPNLFGAAEVGDRVNFWVYADRNVSLTGSCVTVIGTLELDLGLKAGWNQIDFLVTEVSGGFPTRFRVKAVETYPAGVSGLLLPAIGELGTGPFSP